MANEITSNVEPDDVVGPDTVIELQASRPMDPRSAQDAIRVDGQPASIEVVRRGRVALVRREGGFPFGAHRLIIDELLDSKGGMLVDRHELTFSVIPLPQLPTDLRLKHAAWTRLDGRHAQRVTEPRGDGPHVLFTKAVDISTGEPRDVAFDAAGNEVDGDALLAEMHQRRLERCGRLDEALVDRIEQASDDDIVPVTIWARFQLEATSVDKPEEGRLLEPPAGERELDAAVKRATTSLSRHLTRLGIAEMRSDPLVPRVEADVTVGQLRELARAEAIGAVYYRDPEAVFDLGTSISVARTDLAHALGFDGTGINVAIWENGPDVVTNLDIEDRFTSTPATSSHSRLTHAIVKNIERNQPHGHAPDCNLYSANTTGTDALRWAVRDQGCTVVSQSFHWRSEAQNGTLQNDDIFKDYLALRWPYPTIIQAAGNFWNGDSDNVTPPENEFVNHKGFNSMCAANHDDTAGAIAGGSTFRNPTSTHADRELPEIAANGQGVSAAGVMDSGTSFASPAVAGVAALVQDVNSTLCSWPEGCRAILLAGADRNVRDGTWWSDVSSGVDGRDGAGALNADQSVRIALQRRRRNDPATRRGWDIGTLRTSDIGELRRTTFRYHVEVPWLLRDTRVKVALAWDSAVGTVTLPFIGEIPFTSALTVDLDLLVLDANGAVVASSASFDNSYEVVDFAATPGATYDIVIRRWSGTDDVWFGIAWNVTGSLLVFEVERATEFVAHPFGRGPRR